MGATILRTYRDVGGRGAKAPWSRETTQTCDLDNCALTGVGWSLTLASSVRSDACAAQAGCDSAPEMHDGIGTGCSPCLEPPRDHHQRAEPFSAKHARQQACIIGNMERCGALELIAAICGQRHHVRPRLFLPSWPHRLPSAASASKCAACEACACRNCDVRARSMPAGLLQDAHHCHFIEVGAGTAYLSLMLSRACGARKLVLSDLGTFRAKADSILRKQGSNVQFLRCRVNLRDFYIPGALRALQAMQPEQGAHEVPARSGHAFVCYGKHLCGAATDFALRAAIGAGTGASPSHCLP